MNRDHIVFTICGFLLGLIIGTFLLGPRVARSRLAATSAPIASESNAEPPVETSPAPAANPIPPAAGAGPMAAVLQQLNALKQRVAANPHDVESLVQLADMYMDVSKFPQAIDYFQRALAVREDPAVRTDLGICFKQSGDVVKARETFAKVVAEQPEEWQALYNLAICDGELHRLDEARAEIAQLKRMRPGDAEVTRLEQALANAK